ncbi:uncharacterized protein LOC113780989 [Coffea eugenioides]|uniref:uncharacterized protein LOC113780989 n=1 Tax=Coffea eugenioides TaxID=49369 RepID=UPI000F6118FC|nr:uncharacterized protein LOC113780989 [Coffea eugenioides]
MVNMERHHCSYAVILLLSLIIILGLISFSLCFAAEFKRSKKEDLRFNGKLCYLAGSQGFDLGVAALVFLFIAQIIGNLLVCCKFRSRSHERGCKTKQPKIVIISLVLSWISFGVTVILLGAAASMSKSQPYGEGWLDGECYVVKDGIFLGSAILILITLGTTISSIIITIRRRQAEKEGRKVHAQAESA